MTTVEFPVGGGYNAYIGAGAVSLLAREAQEAFHGGRCALIADANLPEAHIRAAQSVLGDGCELMRLNVCEAQKTLEKVSEIYAFLNDAGFTRADGAVILGGGVTGDTAAFAAATYLRGIPFILAPTTVVSQTDSAYGGKTGVDHAGYKNRIGVFAHPRAVVCDVDFLRTLPERERACGMGEVIKYGAIAQPDILERVSRGTPDEELICACVRIKRRLVALDERDTGERRILNFGHTVGHAIEAASGFTLSHGQAVAYGMLAAVRLGERLGVTCAGVYGALLSACEKAGLDTDFEAHICPVLPFLSRDKKSDGRAIDFVLLEGLGRAVRKKLPLEEAERLLSAAIKGRE